jgi:uncharacterized protein (DUF952 family)
MKELIYHITTHTAWDTAKIKGVYHDVSLDHEGFIHCSYSEQLARTANRYFAGQNNLLILGINRSQIGCDVVDEDLYGANELFPHVYGPIPTHAVFDVIPWLCDADGSFSLPSRIRA